MKYCVSLFALLCVLCGNHQAAESPRPKLQIINGSAQPVDIFWLKSATERVPNGTVAPGQHTVITTTLGHRFAVVGRDDKAEMTVTSRVPVQGFRFDPPDKDGVPAFYTQRVTAGGYPIVASAKVNPYALKEAAYLADLMLAKRPDVRAAMIASGSRLSILAWNEFTTDQPEWAWLAKEPVPGFPGISTKDYRDARARGMGGSATDPFCSCAEENLLGYPGDPLFDRVHPDPRVRAQHPSARHGQRRPDVRYGRVQARPTTRRWRRPACGSGKYAGTNHHEYFAEGVQSWFDNNRENDHDHNHVNTRALLHRIRPRLGRSLP